jgi:thiol-disulfide isomerase/thioredoxin
VYPRPRPARCFGPASCARPAGATRERVPRWAWPALTALLAGLVAVTAAGCAGGAIAADTPASSGKSFVSGAYATTYFPPGSRPEAPVISGTTLSGRPLSLRAYRGEVIVINFWGSWCAPCRQEAPALGALARHFRADRVRFLGIDIRDNPASAEAFMTTFRIGYPSLNDPSDNIALAFRGTVSPAGIPSTLVVDRSGRIAARIVGGVTFAGLKALITEVAAGTTGRSEMIGR